jgi:type IV pilus assembly protein PilA
MMNTPAPRTGLAMWSLILGVLSIFTLGCLGIGPLVAIVLGIVALVKVSNAPAEYGGKGMAIGGLVTGALSLVLIPIFIGVIGMVAAIAIPSVLRARVSANEAGALGDTRTVISSQAVYAGTNNGHYDSLECLAAPANCVPGYQGPPILPTELVATEKTGYRRTLHLGAPASDLTNTMSRTSAQSYAYVAVPMTPNQTGVRAFCGDESGVICFTSDGSTPAVVDGRCAQPCNIVQ